MIPLFLFIFDFCCAILLDQWIVHTLTAYFLYMLLFLPASNQRIYGTLFLILLSDCFLYGRFGLALLSLIPLMACIYGVKNVFHRYVRFLWYIGLVFVFFFLDAFFVKKWLFGLNTAPESTIIKIFSTLSVGTLILLGTRGNRFLRSF